MTNKSVKDKHLKLNTALNAIEIKTIFKFNLFLSFHICRKPHQ